jgi:hypothetical protein
MKAVTPLRKRCKIALSKLTPAPPAPHVPNRWRESSSTSHDRPTICRHTPCRATQHPLREASSPEQRSLGKGARPPPRATCVSTPIPRCPFPTRPVPHERGARERHRRRKREQEVEVEVDVEERASGYTTTSAPSTEHPDPHLALSQHEARPSAVADLEVPIPDTLLLPPWCSRWAPDFESAPRLDRRRYGE